MITMQLNLGIDAQKFIQQVQVNNQMIEAEVQKGLDAAFEELAKDGSIENMIKEAVRKNIMDSFSRWVFQSDVRSQVEKQITEKLSARIDNYTTNIINEVADKMNIPKDNP